MLPALASTREYQQSDWGRKQAEPVMEFGMSHRMKPKRIGAHFNEGNWVQFGQSAERKKGAKVAQIGPSRCCPCEPLIGPDPRSRGMTTRGRLVSNRHHFDI